MKDTFRNLIIQELKASLHNDFSDQRKGPSPGLKDRLKSAVAGKLLAKMMTKDATAYFMERSINTLAEYNDRLETLYNLLADEESKSLMVKLIAYRIMGRDRVRLPLFGDHYNKMVERSKKCFDRSDSVEVNYPGGARKIYRTRVNKAGFPIEGYFSGVVAQFFVEQYNYQGQIKAEAGDVVLDCGACFGDSSLYFAHLVGDHGKVVAFEFIPNNMEVLQRNLQMNPNLSPTVDLCPNPLWNEAGKAMYYKDRGPASQVQFEKFEGHDGQTETTTIDKVVSDKQLPRVDFIKMDIEGAEPYALQGAEQTIRTHRPKLAIATYHSMDDFVNIPIWINNLQLGYRFFMKHATTHLEETVIFAVPESR